MNRKFKKILSAVLAVVMIFCAVPVMSFAADSDDYCPYKVGDIIEFGSYPQSEVTDRETLNALFALKDDWIPISLGATQSYSIVSYNGEKYIAFQSDDLTRGSAFKFEPIKWRVIDPEAGLLMSEYVLDMYAFQKNVYWEQTFEDGFSHKHAAYINPECTERVTYANSDIRDWLNNVFDKTAFTEAEYDKIVNKVIDGTNNKSYIPSREEVTCSDYGFLSDKNAYDPNRIGYATEYSSVFARYYISNGKCEWMLRDITEAVHYYCSTFGSANYSDDYMRFDHYDYRVGYDYNVGIRPFIQIGELKTDRTHIPGEWQTIKEPTHTENGKEGVYCTNCNTLLESKVIPRLKRGLKSLELPYDTTEIQHRESITLEPMVTCEQKYTLSYTSSDEEVLTIDENGEITTHGRGTATVTCTATDEDGKTLTDTCEITVKYNFWQWIARIFLYIIGVNSRI